MSALDIWLSIGALFLITLVGRSAYLFAPPQWYPRGALSRALGYAPLAAMVAICAPEVLRGLRPVLEGSAPLALTLLLEPRLLAAIALFALLRTVRNEFASLLTAGLLFWWLTR